MSNTNTNTNTHIDKEEVFKVLYNTSLGRWFPSTKAINLYNIRMKELNPKFNPLDLDLFDTCNFTRHDPVLVQIYRELGKEFDNDNSKTSCASIHKKHVNYYNIEDYDDGCERVIINLDRYELDELKNKLKTTLQNTTMTNDQKIKEIKEISEFEFK